MNEHECQFVSSRGLARSCDVFPSRLISDSPDLNPDDYQDVSDGSVVYVTTTQLKSFIQAVLPELEARVVLVTGDADATIPGKPLRNGEMNRCLLDNDRIMHWFAQNMSLQHPKITQMPIGLDYHTLQGEGWKGDQHGRGEYRTALEQESELISIKESLVPIEDRSLTAYANFAFSLSKERTKALRVLSRRPFVVRETERVSQKETWRRQGISRFVISPMGNGVDCHRTWEALVLGCIPIIRRNYLSDLFSDLPVMFVHSWRDVTEESLLHFSQSMKRQTYNRDKLMLAYWKHCFREASGTSGNDG